MKALITIGMLVFASGAIAQDSGTVRVQGLGVDVSCKDRRGAFLKPVARPPAPPFDAQRTTLDRIKVDVGGRECFLEAKDYQTGSGSVACSQLKSIKPFEAIGGTRGMPDSNEPRCDGR